MIKAGEMTIETTDVEWGVEWTNATRGNKEVMPCADETEARMYADILLNAKVLCRTVLMTPWAEAPQ